MPEYVVLSLREGQPGWLASDHDLIQFSTTREDAIRYTTYDEAQSWCDRLGDCAPVRVL